VSGRPPLEAAAGVIEALADPTRRRILADVAAAGSGTATELARGLPVSRQAVAKHLAALREVGLVRATRAGRETRFEAVPSALTATAAHLADAGAAWDDRLDRLRSHAADPGGAAQRTSKPSSPRGSSS
jgi:DNA-binding transcriptional ArsR family regulator